MKTIEEKINYTFKKFTGVDFLSNPQLQNCKLMGIEIGLMPRDVVYVYCKLEEEFNLEISEKAVLDGKFDTFHNVCKAVKERN